jgi:hypothetical protein
VSSDGKCMILSLALRRAMVVRRIGELCEAGLKMVLGNVSTLCHMVSHDITGVAIVPSRLRYRLSLRTMVHRYTSQIEQYRRLDAPHN